LRNMDEAKEVYVTDRTPKPKKYSTTSKEDDEDFFNYQKSLEEYHKSTETIVEAEPA